MTVSTLIFDLFNFTKKTAPFLPFFLITWKFQILTVFTLLFNLFNFTKKSAPFLPFFSALFVLLTLLGSKILNFDCYLFFKIPLSPFQKLQKTVLECKTFVNNKNKENPNYEQTNTSLIQNLEDQRIITTVSMILESSMESVFQFYFQALYSLPTLFLAYLDIHDGNLTTKQLVNWNNMSIALSFFSFAFTSFNIRCVKIQKMNFFFSFIHSGTQAKMRLWKQNISSCL